MLTLSRKPLRNKTTTTKSRLLLKNCSSRRPRAVKHCMPSPARTVHRVLMPLMRTKISLMPKSLTQKKTTRASDTTDEHADPLSQVEDILNAAETEAEPEAEEASGVEDETEALREDLQRLQAEFVNYRRRVERDRDVAKDNATFAMLEAL